MVTPSRRLQVVLSALSVLLALAPHVASAQPDTSRGVANNLPRTFFGEDLNWTDNPDTSADDPIRPKRLPNSHQAREEFLANLAVVETESFDGLRRGSFPRILFFGDDTATLLGRPRVRRVRRATYRGTYPISGDKFLFQFRRSGTFGSSSVRLRRPSGSTQPMLEKRLSSC